MEWINVVWPPCVLTEEERVYCEEYATAEKPGVLLRVYPKRFSKSTIEGELDSTSGKLMTSGRYAKLFAVTFSGDVELWKVRFSSTSGESYIQDMAPVPLLMGTGPMFGTAAQQDAGVADASTVLLRPGGVPLRWDPMIILEGTQSLQIDCALSYTLDVSERSVLNMAFFVWEFPQAPRTQQAMLREQRGGAKNLPPSTPGGKGKR